MANNKSSMRVTGRLKHWWINILVCLAWQGKEKATTCMPNVKLHNAADVIGEHTAAASKVTAILSCFIS